MFMERKQLRLRSKYLHSDLSRNNHYSTHRVIVHVFTLRYTSCKTGCRGRSYFSPRTTSEIFASKTIRRYLHIQICINQSLEIRFCFRTNISSGYEIGKFDLFFSSFFLLSLAGNFCSRGTFLAVF